MQIYECWYEKAFCEFTSDSLSSNPKKNKQGQRRRSKNITEQAVQQLYSNCPCGWLSKAHNRQICLIDKLSRGLIPRAGKNEQ